MVPYESVLLIKWNKEIGEKLKEIRGDKGISRPKLAKLTNGVVSEHTVIALEFGRVDAVSREKLDALLCNLDCDIRALFPSVTVENF